MLKVILARNLTSVDFVLGRMWAGGRMSWHIRNGLKIGEEVTEETRVIKAEPKQNKAGEEFIVAGVEKRYSTESEGLVLTDQR